MPVRRLCELSGYQRCY